MVCGNQDFYVVGLTSYRFFATCQSALILWPPHTWFKSRHDDLLSVRIYRSHKLHEL